MKRIVLFVLVAVVLAGCAPIQERIGFLADQICLMPLTEREALRATLDLATSPHKVRVECYAQGN